VLEQEWSLAAAAEAAGVSVRTLSKWLRRYREEGEQGLLDRSSASRSVPARTREERVAVIAALRRLRMTAAEIAETLSMPGLDRLDGACSDRAREALAAGAGRAPAAYGRLPDRADRPRRRL